MVNAGHEHHQLLPKLPYRSLYMWVWLHDEWNHPLMLICHYLIIYQFGIWGYLIRSCQKSSVSSITNQKAIIKNNICKQTLHHFEKNQLCNVVVNQTRGTTMWCNLLWCLLAMNKTQLNVTPAVPPSGKISSVTTAVLTESYLKVQRRPGTAQIWLVLWV